ncbi:hypothetical protein [Floridanema evergladense]|uniref:Uncharacterized protein n=1 Tax=Floridaenema evergladense BLCC-F167 TaxID=3153639 RepID=A0ABV4WU65_9CYAN
MSKAEIEAALKAAFDQCNAANCPLTEVQKQILLQVAQRLSSTSGEMVNSEGNPLDELSAEERLALLEFVREQESLNQPWKMQLLNDWLNNTNSGSVQFIRDRYGLQWLNTVEPAHLAEYFERFEDEIKLKAGDRIEVSNGLWEWIQEDGPCSQMWVPCTVISVAERQDDFSSCIIRFDNGTEYEIQGIYDWNRYNWRWLS